MSISNIFPEAFEMDEQDADDMEQAALQEHVQEVETEIEAEEVQQMEHVRDMEIYDEVEYVPQQEIAGVPRGYEHLTL